MKNKAAQALGAIKSEAKTKAAKANGSLGGRPPIDIEPMLRLINEDGPLCRANYYRMAYQEAWKKARRVNRIETWTDDTGVEYVKVSEKP